MHIRRILVSFICLGLFLACGPGGNDSGTSTATGTLTLRLGSDSFWGYDQVVVSIEKVEWSSDGASWNSLGSVQETVDLMALQNGHSAVILPATNMRAGTYNQFRITWATVNYQSAINQPAYAILTGGDGHILTMPTVTIAKGPVTVSANGSSQAMIMLDGAQAVQTHPSTLYTFQATAKAYDLGACARITGHLGDGTTDLSGVEVYAETVDGIGTASVVRRAFTDASGNYALEALLTNNLYFVAAQPAGTVTAYAAKAATPVSASTASTYTADLAFSSSQTPGSLTLDLTPASTATQGTWGELRQTLATGSSGSQILIVRSQTVNTGASQDQVLFDGLAPGTYGVTAQRSTAGAAPVMNVGTQQSVSSGATTPVYLSY